MHRICRMLIAVFLTIAITPWTADAQRAHPQGRRVAAWVAIGSNPVLGREPLLVMRGAGPGRADVLVVGPGATASQLSDAVRTLLTSRSVDGDTASRLGTFRMRTHQANGASRTPFPWTSRVLADVRAAPLRELPGVGRVRAVRIWLPSQGPGRGKARG